MRKRLSLADVDLDLGKQRGEDKRVVSLMEMDGDGRQVRTRAGRVGGWMNDEMRNRLRGEGRDKRGTTKLAFFAKIALGIAKIAR